MGKMSISFEILLLWNMESFYGRCINNDAVNVSIIFMNLFIVRAFVTHF